MSSEATFHYGATMVPVRDVAQSVDFYVVTLGFTALFHADDDSVAVVHRGPVYIHLQACDDEEVLRVTADNLAVYVEVSDVDALWKELGKRLSRLPKGRVRPPFEQEYGMREFHVKDPDGMLMFFGEPVG
ncbi:bleomycin resistance protein [Tepidamorphus sp. 3E244]|uniref:bleomycin resistance protein n=1 Tax=Tepidamorphus sp. 3E244 TaxID=3385498 RepID=UPI0038FC7176